MTDLFSFADDLGPAKIIHVYEPSLGLKAVLVIDNVSRGPSIGGVRMAPDVSLHECVRLARAMTLKNAAAGLPHGGGKLVLIGDPLMASAEKERLFRGLAKALRHSEEYIFGPDMGTDETCMAWVNDEIGRAVGLPRAMGGIPLDEIGATGAGLVYAIRTALDFCSFPIEGARVVVQGFGAVGKHAARLLVENNAVLVGVSDSGGAIVNPDGLDVDALMALKAEKRSVASFNGGRRIDSDALLDVESEIWIPAARPDVINEQNVGRLRTRMVVQGANIPVTAGAERELHRKGILNIPDFIANAGGVICASMEYHGATETHAMMAVEEKIRTNTFQILQHAQKNGLLPRESALHMAVERVKAAMGFRRFSLFSSAPHFL